MALIHSYFVDIFVHGKLFHSSASRTHETIYDVKKCQQNTRESMPKCQLLHKRMCFNPILIVNRQSAISRAF